MRGPLSSFTSRPYLSPPYGKVFLRTVHFMSRLRNCSLLVLSWPSLMSHTPPSFRLNGVPSAPMPKGGYQKSEILVGHTHQATGLGMVGLLGSSAAEPASTLRLPFAPSFFTALAMLSPAFLRTLSSLSNKKGSLLDRPCHLLNRPQNF